MSPLDWVLLSGGRLAGLMAAACPAAARVLATW